MAMKKNYEHESSNVYWLEPRRLREDRVEVNEQGSTTGRYYDQCPRRGHLPDAERLRLYESLRAHFAERGFSENDAIRLMLNRTDAGKDKIIDGHHRLAIAIELKAPLIPVRFVYA